MWLVLLASLAVATASPLAKAAIGVSPIAIAAGRTAVAAVAIAIAIPRATIRAVAALDRRGRRAVALGGSLLAAHFALFLGGLARTSLPAAVALVSLEPLSVVLAAFFAFRIRPTRRELAGVVLATLGAAIVASGAGEGEHRMEGDLLVLGAVVFYGAYVAMARALRDAMPVLPYAAVVSGVASILLLPAAVVLSRGAAAPAASWGAVVALGLVPTLVGHTLTQAAARRVAPPVVALVAPGETIGSLAIGAVALGAFPSAVEACGAGLIVAGATVAILARPSPPPAEAPGPRAG